MTGGALAPAAAALDRRLDPASTAPLAVAVSGGGDSIALLHLAADWAGAVGRPLRVLTVDHGLNPESAAWARFVADAAGDLALPCTVLHWTGEKPSTGTPAAARVARHALLAEAARALGARMILMGHTADDLAEGEVMRLEGSTVGDPREWSPSPAWPEGRGVFLLRPLLGVSRASLRDFLRYRGARWLEDPANHDQRFARARARSRPPASASERATFQPDELAPDVAEETAWGGLLFRPGDLVFRQRLSAAVLCASGGGVPPRGARIAGLAKRLAEDATVNATLSGAKIVSDASITTVGRERGRVGPPRLPVHPGPEQVWDGRFALKPEEAGVVSALSGRTAKLSKPERTSLKSAPPWARPTLPILETPSGAVRLLPEARPLALARFRAACGVYVREADLPSP